MAAAAVPKRVAAALAAAQAVQAVALPKEPAKEPAQAKAAKQAYPLKHSKISFAGAVDWSGGVVWTATSECDKFDEWFKGSGHKGGEIVWKGEQFSAEMYVYPRIRPAQKARGQGHSRRSQ